MRCLSGLVCQERSDEDAVLSEGGRRIKKVWNLFTTIVLILVVTLVVLLAGVRLIGFEVFSVLSGSMEPALSVGSLVYVKDVDPASLKPGETITYMVNDSVVVTHRLVEVVEDPDEPGTLWFRTKGDANDSADMALVHYRNVIGRAMFAIPYLGYVANYIQSPPGLYVALGAGVFLLLLAFLPTGGKKTHGKGHNT